MRFKLEPTYEKATIIFNAVGTLLSVRSGRELPPPLDKLLRQRHLIDDQIAALFNVVNFNPQVLA
jgi:hypothetical protein